MVELRLLGELQVLHEGKLVPLPASKKTRALLGYLVITGREQLRGTLCSLLWEGPDDPRAALRWSLTKLRPLVDRGATRLVADRERVAFRREGAKVDLDDLRGIALQSAALDDLVAMAERVRGELLEGLDLLDCHRYQQWCMAERDGARTLHRKLLAEIVERVRADPTQALEWARRRCAIDPLDEDGHAEVVALLGRLGRTSEARAHYEQARRMLVGELGRRSVSVKLEQARRSLGAVVEPAEPIPIVTTPVDRGGEAFVGREEERAALQRLVDAARTRTAECAAIVIGEPGIGKSRLLDELARMVAVAGGTVLRGRGFEAELVRPYGAWLDAFRSAGISDEALRNADDRAHLFDAVLAVLRSRGAPALVLLDDLQWIDEASIALLHFAVRELHGSHVLFACAARSGELGDNAAALRLVRSLTRERRALRLDLGALDETALAELLRAHAYAADSARVHADTGGNPLYALEVARAVLRGAEPAESLDVLLRDRLDGLDASAREVVGWAAAFGHGLSLDDLQRASGIGQVELLVAVERLQAHGFLRTRVDGDTYDFVHDLLRSAAYRSMSEPRRRLVHLHIARALHARADDEGVLAGDIAHHAGLGGAAEMCAEACLAAARRCLRMFATKEAVALTRRGLQQLDRVAGTKRLCLRVELLRIAVLAEAWKGRVEGLVQEIERAVTDAQAAGLTAEAALGVHTLAVLHFERGDFASARGDSLRAQEIVGTASDLGAARALARSAMCLAVLEKDLDTARQTAAEARRRGGALASELPELALAEGLLLAHEGDDARAIAVLERAQASSEAAADHYIDSMALMALARIALARGDFAIARRRAAQLRAVAARLGEGSEGPVAVMFDVLARASSGESGIDDELERALQTLRDIDNHSFLAYALRVAGSLDLATGHIDRARVRAEEGLASAMRVGADAEIARVQELLAALGS